MAAPAATPPDIIAAAGKALQATLADAELARRLMEMGLAPMPKTPAEMKRHMEEQIVIWGQRVAAAGIEPQ